MNKFEKPLFRYSLHVIKWIIILILFIVVNKSITNSETRVFLGKNLPSALVAHDAEKVVDGLDKLGNLTFGPYISLDKGEYIVTLYYETSTAGNFIDVFSGQTGVVYYKDYLDIDSEQKKIDLKLDSDIAGLEVRTFYNGEGSLEVKKITIEDKVNKYQIFVNVLLVLVVVLYELKIKKLTYEKKFVFAVLVFLCMPMMLGTFYKYTGKKVDVDLKGNFDTYIKPEFQLDTFFSREFQSGYEKWWNENFVPRGYIISAYNQVRYSLFDLGNRIIGKEKSIYEDAYIEDELCMSDSRDYTIVQNQNQMRAYLAQLESISKNLKKLGKEFLVYTTPNKATEQQENIPQKYIWKYEDKNKVRAVDYFRSIVNEYELTYLDTATLLNTTEREYPVFYKTGIHWSRPAEQRASQEILRILKSKGVPVGFYELGKLSESKYPYWRDSDVFDLLNIFRGVKDSLYYQYETTVIEEGTANVLVQGGSFAQGFRKDFIENRAGLNIVDIFYNQYVEEANGTILQIPSWESMDIGSYIEQANVVIVEVNEQALSSYSNGFVQFLSEFLEKNVGGTITENNAHNNMINYEENLEYGFYGLETDYRWIAEEAKISFANSNVPKTGLEIELNIPDILSNEGNVEIIINNAITKTIPLKNKGRHNIIILPEELFGGEIYEVVISTADTFVPKEEGINTDDRILGIQVFYIGEKR